MSHKLLAFLIVASMQLTDSRIGDIKLGDIFSIILIIYFVVHNKYILKEKVYSILLFSFTFFLVLSFISLTWVDVYASSSITGILKQPGWVSISRYIQMIGCVFFALFFHKILTKNNDISNHRLLKDIDIYMNIFFLFFLGTYVISFLGLDTPFVYGEHRLRGGFIEGGPFGLFVVSYICFKYIVIGIRKRAIPLYLALIFASQSKAAILFLLVFAFINFLFTTKVQVKKLFVYGMFVLMLLIIADRYFSISNRLYGYISDIENIEEQISLRPNDNNLVMGRIAATYITPNIIKDNILVGVGLGNYSLVRNNPQYRGIFPEVEGWDLTGLGGLINLLVETGVIGLLLFMSVVYKYVWLEAKQCREMKYLVVLFILCQIYGVQIYFQYIWMYLGVCTALIYGMRSSKVLLNCQRKYLNE